MLIEDEKGFKSVDLLLHKESGTGSLSFKTDNLQSHNIEEDDKYIYPVFRAVSAIVIPGHFLDLTKKNVLKNSTNLLKNQTVYPNHHTDVNQWLGKVLDVKWDDSQEPVGINAKLQIDKTSNERIVKGIQMGALHSVSVGLNFNWTKSHERDDFFKLLGDEIDGKVVSLVVTKIFKYNEISLVYQGADPYAKRRAQLSKITVLDNYINTEKQQEDNMQITLTKEQANKVGLEIAEFVADDTLTELDIDQSRLNGILAQSKLNLGHKNREINKLNHRVESLTSHLSKLGSKDVTTLSEAEIELEQQELLNKIKLGDTYISQLRQSAENNYRLAKGEAASSSIVELIQNSELSILTALDKEYQNEAKNLHPLTCECGKVLSRQSSQQNTEKEALVDKSTLEQYKD